MYIARRQQIENKSEFNDKSKWKLEWVLVN